MTRTRAALTHLAVSVTLAVAAAFLILSGWFTLPYFWLIGGPLLLALIVGVDVILGPLMTFIVCAPGKSRKELFFDLSLIGLLQAAALVYGLHASYTSRLVYAVYVDGAFHLVKSNELGIAGVGESKRPEFFSLPLFGPHFIGAQLPTTAKGVSDLSFYRTTGVGDFRVPEYYVPLVEVRQQMVGHGLSREALAKRNPALLKNVDALLSKSRLKWTQVGVFPLDVLQRGTYTVVVNMDEATVLKVLAQSPNTD
ncbi:MAG: hypothetical protein Q8S73_26930 [Deltaproteobacteria bacterium]|nr:hypothetical protein [Deltaproteobacteria bacterium]